MQGTSFLIEILQFCVAGPLHNLVLICKNNRSQICEYGKDVVFLRSERKYNPQ